MPISKLHPKNNIVYFAIVLVFFSTMFGGGRSFGITTPLSVAVFGPVPVLAGIAVSGAAQSISSMDSAVLGPRRSNIAYTARSGMPVPAPRAGKRVCR